MDYTELITESISTLFINKTRTGLAILGIVIGIGSVIALISLGQASQAAITSQIQSLGANLLTVMPGSQRAGAVRSAAGSVSTLTLDDALAIQSAEEVTTVLHVSPELTRRSQVTTGSSNTNTQIAGVMPIYATVRKVEVTSGSFIREQDVVARSKVAVLGPQVAIALFGDEASALGKSIRISGQTLKVIGVSKAKGGTGFQNQDDIIYVPLTTAQKVLFGTTVLSTISLQARDESVMVQAQNEVGYLLLRRHKLNDVSQADFSIFSQQDILSTASAATGTFTTLLSGVAAISLLVGGIGIMNIMLMSVTERTREIGLRKALGAKKKSIITQFLIEAILLTSTGGVIGIVLGIAASWIIAQMMGSLFLISTESIALATGVSGGIGIVFGWYPAQKAAELQPIEALRYE